MRREVNYCLFRTSKRALINELPSWLMVKLQCLRIIKLNSYASTVACRQRYAQHKDGVESIGHLLQRKPISIFVLFMLQRQRMFSQF